MIYVFGDYALDTRLYELRHGGEPCPLGPQVFNVLTYLIAHRDHVVTKDELIEHLWPAQSISDATVHQHVTAARKAIGDSGRQQRIVKTLRSRGYRFIAPVEVRDHEAPGRDRSVTSEAARHAAQQMLQPAAEAPPTLHGALMAERKLVTVLGGTLANAVTLVERLGLEVLPRLRQALLDLVEHEVQPYHGTLQMVGNDGFLVLFGVPVALEELYADRLAEQVDRLAHHALRGEVWDKALAYCRQAGARAVERSALREAAVAFEQALAALQHLPDSHATREQAIDLHFDLRNALHPFNEDGRILDHLRQAEPLAEAFGDQRRLGQLAGYLSVCLRHQGRIDEALASAQHALAIGTALGDIGLQVAANSFLGELYLWDLNDYRQAAEVFRRNVEILHGTLLRERFGTTNVQSVVCRAQVARCLAELGAFAEGRAYAEDALRLAETVDHPYSLIWVCYGVGHFFLRQGTLSQAIHLFERALALREAVHFPLVIRQCQAELGVAYTLSGRVSEALPLLERGAEGSHPAGIWGQAPLFRVWLGQGYVLAGRLEEAMQLGQQALEMARSLKRQGYQRQGYEAYTLRLLGDVASHRTPPEVEEAEHQYCEALALAEAIGMRPLQAHCHSGLGMLYAKLDQRQQARMALAMAVDLYCAMDMTFWLPEAKAALAQLEER